MDARAAAISHEWREQRAPCPCRFRQECTREFRSPPRDQFARSVCSSRDQNRLTHVFPGGDAVRGFLLPSARGAKHFQRSRVICPSREVFLGNQGRQVSSLSPPSQYSPGLKSERSELSRRPFSNPPTTPIHCGRASQRPRGLDQRLPFEGVRRHGPRCRKPLLHAPRDGRRAKATPVCLDHHRQEEGELCAASVGPLGSASRKPRPESRVHSWVRELARAVL